MFLANKGLNIHTSSCHTDLGVCPLISKKLRGVQCTYGVRHRFLGKMSAKAAGIWQLTELVRSKDMFDVMFNL